MAKQVHAQIGVNGLPIRIFNDKSWRDFPEDQVRIMDRAHAVGAIRAQVFDRSIETAQEGHCLDTDAACERCGRRIRWETFEMNEKIPKGSSKRGEVSVENCEALCHACHQGDADSAHGNRRWQSAKIKS